MTKSLTLALLLATPLAGCATMPTEQTVSTVSTYVQRGAAAWSLARSVALAWLPRLSPARQDQVRHAVAIGDAAIADAQTAVTLAQAVPALQRANGAIAEVSATVR